jgi:hypothetical protein
MDKYQVEILPTDGRWPNLYAAGIRQIINVRGPRGAVSMFNRNDKGRTWFAAGSRPSFAAQRLAEQASS